MNAFETVAGLGLVALFVGGLALMLWGVGVLG